MVEPSRDALAELIAGGSVEGRLSIVGFQSDRGPSIYIDREVVRAIAQLGVDVNVDFYVVGTTPTRRDRGDPMNQVDDGVPYTVG